MILALATALLEEENDLLYVTKKWRSWGRSVPLIVLLLAFWISEPTPVQGGLVAGSLAFCEFTGEVNASLGLNATVWFQRPFNDSWTWEHNSTLTWAFDPNLAFWTFFYDEVLRITATVAPEVPVREVWWRLPVQYPDYVGYIIDWNNGSYAPTLNVYLKQFGNLSDHEGLVLVENLTFVLSEQWVFMRHLQLLPSTHWGAKVYWFEVPSTLDLSDAEWNAIAERFSTHLNATWYVKSCRFYKTETGSNGSEWPFDAIFLGLLVLMGWGSKRRLSTKKRVS